MANQTSNDRYLHITCTIEGISNDQQSWLILSAIKSAVMEEFSDFVFGQNCMILSSDKIA